MTIEFTSRTAATIWPTPGKRIECFDLVVPGLALRVTPTGAKSWCVLYRHRGRLRRLTLGRTAVLSLADARARARDTLRSAHDGDDPATAKQQARTAETIADLVRDYIEQHATGTDSWPCFAAPAPTPDNSPKRCRRRSLRRRASAYERPRLTSTPELVC
jgi:hypothetical protein